jgi:hypothetical protein
MKSYKTQHLKASVYRNFPWFLRLWLESSKNSGGRLFPHVLPDPLHALPRNRIYFPPHGAGQNFVTTFTNRVQTLRKGNRTSAFLSFLYPSGNSSLKSSPYYKEVTSVFQETPSI